ncbi:hypothetical protein KUTeg_007966 [Tegillarca granosa]|uniref:Nucleoporin Nup43 n=1 Tax=Tegillarca granosa TaxID=220873 RepID=A0ABQ9FET0_TEGGR|nr:hypothetical protein KUTeg_007966 [Tegillarca granosa]
MPDSLLFIFIQMSSACHNTVTYKFIGQENIIVSSSSGTVTLYKHHKNSQTLGIIHQWDKLHRHAIDQPSPCTCIATRGDEVIVSAGEDGRINVLHIGQKSPNPYKDTRDSSTINSIIFLKQTEFITVNSTGQLKIYDMRLNSSQPSQTLSLTGDLSPLQCIDKHPGQPHIITTGGQDGTLVWEVKFHKQNPDHIFTCSEDGSVWHWDGSNVNSVAMATGSAPLLAGTGAGSGGGLSTASHFQFGGSGVRESSPWLATDIAKNKIEINALVSEDFCNLPVNSLDIEGHSLLCGTDGETILQISLPMLR